MALSCKGLVTILCLLLALGSCKISSSWKKLPSKNSSVLLSSFVQLSGPAHYYSFKEGTNQRILLVELLEDIDGRSRSLALEIDLLCTNAEKYPKIQVDTSVVFQVVE
jgi:hypothetical protein